MTKQLIFFKRYLVPNPKEDSHIFKLVLKYYWLLSVDKGLGYLIPIIIRTAMNSLVAGAATPLYLAALFSTFGFSQILRTYMEGSRIIINGQITRLAFLDISTRVYESLLNLDL